MRPLKNVSCYKRDSIQKSHWNLWKTFNFVQVQGSHWAVSSTRQSTWLLISRLKVRFLHGPPIKSKLNQNIKKLFKSAPWKAFLLCMRICSGFFINRYCLTRLIPGYVNIDFQIINFTRPEGGRRISYTSTTDNTVKLFIWKSIGNCSRGQQQRSWNFLFSRSGVLRYEW